MSWSAIGGSGGSTAIYAPESKDIDASSGANPTVYFDGSEASTDNALITMLEGTVDCHLFVERYDSNQGQYVETAQLTDASGNETFTGQWATQGNELQVSKEAARIRVESVEDNAGTIGASGYVLQDDS